jgi:hypothetical protein
MSHWLPAYWRTAVEVPYLGTCTFSIDTKLAAEYFVLVVSLAGVRHRLSEVLVDLQDTWIQHGERRPRDSLVLL